MRKLITAAMLTALASHAFAQENNEDQKTPAPPTPAQQNFEMPKDWVNIRDYIYLPNKAKLIVELTHVEQYDELKKIDALLAAFIQDIAFYKDSLSNNTGSVRIDYTQDDEMDIRKIRFRKHASDGDVFMDRLGEKARLKIDQDTVRIYVRHNPAIPMSDKKTFRQKFDDMHNNANFYQLTFCVNSYEDIAKIAAGKQTLQHAIDTMMATKKKGTKNDPYHFPSSALYNPYATRNDVKSQWWRARADVRFRQGGLLKSETPQNWGAVTRADNLAIDANIGVGLLRNYWAPCTEIGVSFSKLSSRLYNGEYRRTVIGLNSQHYFLFERDANNEYHSKPNWFVNATISEVSGFKVGAGYLIQSDGDFFKRTTMKLYADVRMLKKGLTLSPELIFTNNFQQIIPAITLKVF